MNPDDKYKIFWRNHFRLKRLRLLVAAFAGVVTQDTTRDKQVYVAVTIINNICVDSVLVIAGRDLKKNYAVRIHKKTGKAVPVYIDGKPLIINYSNA